MSMTAAIARNERLRRQVDAAAAHLHAIDAATIRRVGGNMADHEAGRLSGAEAVGVLSVNVEELLEIIERLARPEGGDVFCRTCGFYHAPGSCPRWPAS